MQLIQNIKHVSLLSSLDVVDAPLLPVPDVVVGCDGAHVQQEVPHHVKAAVSQVDLGVELDAVERALGVG